LPLLFRVVSARPRLFVATGVGLVVIIVTAFVTDWRFVTRLLTGWDIAVALYLVLAFHVCATSDIRRIRRNAARQDDGQLTILTCTVAAALASLAAIFAELGMQSGRRPLHTALAGATILLSWAFIHTIFALHYAHEFYDADIGGGLAFPGGEREPDYWDFVYFSFVIGMTSQVSDIGVTNRMIRRIVTAHGVVSFVFNATLLALTVNLAASAI